MRRRPGPRTGSDPSGSSRAARGSRSLVAVRFMAKNPPIQPKWSWTSSGSTEVTGRSRARPIASAISSGRDALLGDGVQTAPRGRLRQTQRDQPRRVGAVDGRPAVGAVARVAGDALRAGDAGDRRDEAVVAGAVDGRREPQAHRADATVDELEREVLARRRAASRGRGTATGRPRWPGGPGCRPATPEASRNGRPAAGERVADGLHGGPLGRVRDGRVGEVVLVGEMEDGVGVRGAGRGCCRGRRGRRAGRAAPLAARAAAEASDRARPVTS